MKNLKKLDRNNLKAIKGGDDNMGYCPDSQTYIPCDQLCEQTKPTLCFGVKNESLQFEGFLFV